MPCQPPFVSKHARHVDLSFPQSSCCFLSQQKFIVRTQVVQNLLPGFFPILGAANLKALRASGFATFSFSQNGRNTGSFWQAIFSSTGKSSKLTLGKNPFTKAASDAALEPSSGFSFFSYR